MPRQKIFNGNWETGSVDSSTRSISLKQAYNCEHSSEKRCRCRCGGKFHGAGRVASADGFGRLHDDDPHYVVDADTGLREIVGRRKTKSRRRGFVWILTLVCGHIVERAASAVGLSNFPTRAHCDVCKPAAVQNSRIKRSMAQGSTLAKYFMKKGR